MARQKAAEKGKFAKAEKAFGSMVLSPVSRAVRPLVKKLIPQKSAIFQQLYDVWPDLMAGTEAADAIPEKLNFPRGEQKDAVLFLWAKTGADATEITFGASQILGKINALFGYALVRELRVTAFPTTFKNAPQESGNKAVSGPKASCQSLDKMLVGISNPALKSMLADLGGLLNDNPTQHNIKKGVHDA